MRSELDRRSVAAAERIADALERIADIMTDQPKPILSLPDKEKAAIDGRVMVTTPSPQFVDPKPGGDLPDDSVEPLGADEDS